MKTKFVTSYYMDVSEFTNYKWIGSYASRKPRYLSSLINHCKNFSSYDIVCYTHQINYDELLKIKNDYELNNLTIKVKELDDIKYTEKINKVVNNVPDYMEKFGIAGRPPQVMWGKFDLIRLECTNDIDNIYKPYVMLELGNYYYNIKDYDNMKKYYIMAIENDYDNIKNDNL